MSEPLAPTLDQAVLAGLRDSVGGDDAFVADLVETYLADGADQVAAIEAALNAGDAAALVRPAHTLKSASYTVGAMRLGDLARTLEQGARADGPADASVDLEAVTTAWSATERALRAWLAGTR